MVSRSQIERYILKITGAFFASVSLPVSIILVTPILLEQFGFEGVAKYNLIFFGLNLLMVFFQGLFTTTIKEMSSEATLRIARFVIVERFMLPASYLLALILYSVKQTHFMVAMSLLPTHFYSAVLVGLGAQFLQGTILGAIHLCFAAMVYAFSSTINNIDQISLIYFTAVLVGTGLLRITVSRRIKNISNNSINVRVNWSETRKISISEGLGIISSIIDRTAVFLLLPTATFGVYSLATTIGKATSFIRTPLLRVFTPYLLDGKGNVARKTANTSIVLCAVIMPILGFISAYCPRVFELWVGPQTEQTILVTRLILVGAAFHTSATPFYYSLINLDKVDAMVKLNLFISFFLLLGSSLGAFWFGMVAVAVLWMFSNIIIFFSCYIILLKYLDNAKILKKISIFIFPLTALPIFPLLIFSI